MTCLRTPGSEPFCELKRKLNVLRLHRQAIVAAHSPLRMEQPEDEAAEEIREAVLDDLGRQLHQLALQVIECEPGDVKSAKLLAELLLEYVHDDQTVIGSGARRLCQIVLSLPVETDESP